MILWQFFRESIAFRCLITSTQNSNWQCYQRPEAWIHQEIRLPLKSINGNGRNWSRRTTSICFKFWFTFNSWGTCEIFQDCIENDSLLSCVVDNDCSHKQVLSCLVKVFLLYPNLHESGFFKQVNIFRFSQFTRTLKSNVLHFVSFTKVEWINW